MTYFFAEGHIYVILNKLAKLSTKDYNAAFCIDKALHNWSSDQDTLWNLGFYKIKVNKCFEALRIWQYFATMKSMNIGKSSTQFFKTAAELDNIVLLTKKPDLWGLYLEALHLPFKM